MTVTHKLHSLPSRHLTGPPGTNSLEDDVLDLRERDADTLQQQLDEARGDRRAARARARAAAAGHRETDVNLADGMVLLSRSWRSNVERR